MPHGIGTTPEGEDAMVYVGRSPWHRLGTRIDPSQARDLDLVVAKAGLDFQVEKEPRHALVRLDATDPRTPHLITDGIRYRVERGAPPFAVVRTDTGEELGSVEDAWHPLQNRDAFEPLRGALDQGLATVETGGVLHGGKEVWMLVRFHRDSILRAARRSVAGPWDAGFRRLVDTLEGEPGGGILPYGLLYNDHSGGQDARVQQTAIRVVCANTLAWALRREEGGSTHVPHRAGVRGAYKAAVEALFRNLVPGYQALADQRAMLKHTTLSEEDFSRLVVNHLPPLPLPLRSPAAPGSGGLKALLEWMEERKRVGRVEVRRLWEEGAGHRGDRSAWEAYNGLVQWLDHSPRLGSGEERLSGLLTGRLSWTKERVYARLLAHAMERSGGKATRDGKLWETSLPAPAPPPLPFPLTPAGTPGGKA
jgi:hypothetical protein